MEKAKGIGQVSVFLPEGSEDEAGAIDRVLRDAGYDPAETQVVGLMRLPSVDEAFVTPFRPHEEWLDILNSTTVA